MLRIQRPVWSTNLVSQSKQPHEQTESAPRYRSEKVVAVLQGLHDRAKSADSYTSQPVPRSHARSEAPSAILANVNNQIALRLAQAQHSRAPNARTRFPTLRRSIRIRETLSIPRAAEPVGTKTESVLPSPTGPSILQEIENTISKISMGKGGQSAERTKVNLQVFWELRRCLQTELDNSADLSSTLTVTGNGDHSWATSCQEYVSERWAEFGMTLLGSLESVLQKVVKLEEAITVSGSCFTFSLALFS